MRTHRGPPLSFSRNCPSSGLAVNFDFSNGILRTRFTLSFETNLTVRGNIRKQHHHAIAADAKRLARTVDYPPASDDGSEHASRPRREEIHLDDHATRPFEV